MIGRLKRQVARGIRKCTRLNEAAIMEALRSFGTFRSEHLLIHSSLSRCGNIIGGPKSVIGALRSWIGNATMIMPAFAYCYPTAEGQPCVYDPASSPSQVGAVGEYFRREPAVVRGLHPTHSLCVQGPGAEALNEGHELCETPCGKGTPFERLVLKDAAVLMLGAPMSSYTLFHTAEDAGQAPYLYEPSFYKLHFRGKDGGVHEMRMRRQDMSVPRRFAERGEWLEKKKFLIRRKLGWGELLFIPHAQPAHEALVAAIRQDPYFLAVP